MKKFLLGTLIFLVVLVFAAPFLIPTKKVAQKIASVIEENVHKKTSIENVRFTIVPQLGVRVNGISIGEKGKDDYYAQLQSFFLQVQWRPLLKKQVHISTIEFSHPIVEMYATKAAASQPNPPASQSESKPANVKLNIQKLLIDQAMFTMFDEKMKPSVHVEGFCEDLSFNYASDGPSTLEGKTLIPVLAVSTPMGVLGRDTKIDIQKKIQFDSKNVNVQELKISLGSLPISLTGSVQNYNSDNPFVDIQFSGGPSDIENIIGLIPSNMISADLKNIQSKGNLFVEGKLKGSINTKNPAASVEKSDFAVNMTLKGGSVSHPQLQKPMENISFAIRVNPKTLTIQDFNTNFGQSVIHYSAIVQNYLTNPTFQFETNSSVDLKDVASLRQDLPVKELVGDVSVNMKATGSASNVNATILNGSITAKEIGMKYPEFNYNIEHINSIIKLDKNNVNINNLSMLINGSDLSAKGTIQNPTALMEPDRTSSVKFALQASSKNLNVDKLMPPETPEEESSELPEPFYKLDGSLGFNVQKLTFNKLEMTQGKGTLILKNGIVQFKPVSVGTFSGTVTLNGDVNLKNPKKPTFDLDTELKNVQVQKALAYAENINKLLKLDNSLSANIGLKAKAKGDLTKDYSLNMSSLSSSGSFSLTNATLQNHPIQKAFDGFFKSDQFKSFSIKQWTQAFAIKDGKLDVSNLSLGAKDFDFKINGWQSIDGKNNFDVDAKLPAALTAKIMDKLPSPVAALVKTQKQITLPFSVGGEATSPNVTLNSQKLSANTQDIAKEQLKEQTSKLTTSAKDEAKKLIPGSKSTSTSKKPTVPKKEDVKKSVSDKLKKLF